MVPVLSGAAGSLEVTATEDGKILRYGRCTSGRSNRRGTLSLTSRETRSWPRRRPRTFLDRVLGRGGVGGAGQPSTPAAGWGGPSTAAAAPTAVERPALSAVLLPLRAVQRQHRHLVLPGQPGGRVPGDIPAARFPHRRGGRASSATGDTTLAAAGVCALRDGTAAVLRYLPNPTDKYYGMTSRATGGPDRAPTELGRGCPCWGTEQRSPRRVGGGHRNIAKSLAGRSRPGGEALTGASE